LARQNGDLHSQLDRLTHRNAELQRENEDFRKEQGDRSVAIDRIRFENGQLAMNLEEAKRELRSK
jgi:regulator of replication initiation timing